MSLFGVLVLVATVYHWCFIETDPEEGLEVKANTDSRAEQETSDVTASASQTSEENDVTSTNSSDLEVPKRPASL